MTDPVITYDNTWNREQALTDKQKEDLSLIDGRTVRSLCERNNHGVSLLVFPDSLGKHGDKIGDQTIIDIRDGAISTGNIMGFIGCRDTKLRICSRFDKDNNNFFLHYMLSKVFSLNIFDLQHSTDRDSVFDFILFFFPYFLNRALSQGLYKEYVTVHHNDSQVRGVIDVSRHIRLNFPFKGSVAYKTREHTADNPLIELVRHTIEYIRTTPFGSGILTRDEEIKANVAMIVEATPRYERRDRLAVINQNLRTRVHPYFTEYEPLRNLCLQILRQEELKYGDDDDTVFGVLFDGAWLWETYLNTILSSHGFKHPDNIAYTGGFSLFKHSSVPRFPDFLSTTAVLDAKYKAYADKQNENNGKIREISREDLAQVISYMYVQQLPSGGFLVPGGTKVERREEKLRGYGGSIFLFNLPIPQNSPSYQAFCQSILQNEIELGRLVDSMQSTQVLQ